MKKEYPEIRDFHRFIASINEQLTHVDSHSDFDAVIDRFCRKVKTINFEEYIQDPFN